ncbi:MAG TPA: rhamnan synthesis F family protein [Candidatus Saccharimonadales bacterium]|nr:rhamnan synthesis F family protein [Candidatus Saccharimonadales bacterium]
MSNYSDNFYNDDVNTPWHKIIQMVPEGSRVLDIGCSSGNLGEELIKEKKCEVTGIDLDEDDVNKARKKLTNAYVMNAETANLQKLGKFDCIIFADVLEHLLDPVKTLEKIKKSLKPGGVVIFSIPNMAHMATRLMLLEGRFVYGETGLLDKTHLHYYDRQEVQRIFKNAGYTIEHFDWVERYLPKKVVTHQLNNIGLEPSEEFFRRNQNVESSAYEFIGKAGFDPSSKLHEDQLPFVSPNVKSIEAQIKDVEAINQQTFQKEKDVLNREIDELLHKEARLISSISWRITLPLRLINGVVWTIRQKIRIYIYGATRNPRLQLSKYGELRDEIKAYEEAERTLDIKRSPHTETAVLIHLYYADTWPLLQKRLAILKKELSFDLFITIPRHDKESTDIIRKEYPDAHIITVPNRGRDVLPFLRVAPKLEAAGYKYILKLHSKKSPHRDDGHTWFQSMLECLIPGDSFSISALKATLEKPTTGVIGPVDQYVPLTVNYDANSYFLFKALKKIYSKAIANDVHNKERQNYGFFAGTMFWARADALSEIFRSNFGVADFEREKGRVDGTLAHAMERVFCIVPEIDGKKIYEIAPDTVRQIEYRSDNIPEWSELHIKNQKRRSKLSS